MYCRKLLGGYDSVGNHIGEVHEYEGVEGEFSNGKK